MKDSDHGTLRIARTGGVTTATIDNPPVNVLDVALMGDLRRFLIAAREEPDTKVIVFESIDPEIFVAHVDMALIDEPQAFDEIAREVPEGLNVFQALGELVRSRRRSRSSSSPVSRAAAARSSWPRPT